VFSPLSAILSLLFFASTLPNGIRLVELPSQGESIQIVAGYTSGGLNGFASTSAARAFLLDSYVAGSHIELIKETDRTAFRITAPSWALPALSARLASLFNEVPAEEESVPAPPSDFRAKVEEEIRNALLGPAAAPMHYATENAFVLITGQAPAALQESLAAIPRRSAPSKADGSVNRLAAERTLRFKSDLPTGAIIFASPTAGVYYRQWYSMLLLDKLIHRIVPIRLATTLPLTVAPRYYRLELTVPAGQFPEPAEENLLQELQRLQFTPANARDLTAARQDAVAHLESTAVREWFASHDLVAQREEGVQWINSMSADDMRVAARDLLIMNRVIATWAPKAQQTTVTIEALDSAGAVNNRPAGSQTAARTGTAEPAQIQVTPAPFPAHTDQPTSVPLPERLASGVSIAASATNAVFVSGGTLSRFDRDFTADDVKAFQQHRAERILVLTPPSSMERARQIWTTFKGSTAGDTGSPKGTVSSGDLPALYVLKTMLDLKLLEAGWFSEASVAIDASEGSGLQIRASDRRRQQVIEWIKAIANAPIADDYFAWAREIAIHHYDSVRADLQALTWDRDRQGTVQPLETVSSRHVQDVARIYF
jgi:hypothetical protein